MRRNSLRILVLAFVLALGCGCALAQVTVNAPEGLTNRKSKEQKEQTTTPAQSKSSTTKSATPAKKETTTSTPKPATSTKSEPAATTQHSGGSASSGDSYSSSSQSVQRRITGYRVQVLFSSNKTARTTARARAKDVATKYPQYRTYISYVAPQWRLRIGDFKSKSQADAVARKIRASFPSFRGEVIVVQDKINVWG